MTVKVVGAQTGGVHFTPPNHCQTQLTFFLCEYQGVVGFVWPNNAFPLVPIEMGHHDPEEMGFFSR